MFKIRLAFSNLPNTKSWATDELQPEHLSWTYSIGLQPTTGSCEVLWSIFDNLLHNMYMQDKQFQRPDIFGHIHA